MTKDDAWWLRTFYISFGLLLGFAFWKFVHTIGVQTGWLERYESSFGPAAFAISVVAAVASAWYLASDKNRHEYLLASIGELRKVTWPSMVDTRRMTIIVCIVVGIFAVILAVFDFVWSKALALLLA